MEQNVENIRRCGKCLTRDMAGQEAYFCSLREYIANLDDDIKASTALYEERLAICKQCELLLDGMCRSCGCYVELRAVVAGRSCPWNKWKAAEKGELYDKTGISGQTEEVPARESIPGAGCGKSAVLRRLH